MVQSPDDDWRETNNLEFPLRDSTCRAGGAPRVIRKHKFHMKVCLCQFHTEDRFHVNFPDSFAYMHVLHRGLLSHKSFVMTLCILFLQQLPIAHKFHMGDSLATKVCL